MKETHTRDVRTVELVFTLFWYVMHIVRQIGTTVLEIPAESTPGLVLKIQEVSSSDMTHWYLFTILHGISGSRRLIKGLGFWTPFITQNRVKFPKLS
jgi:hypothetical protein